MSAFIDRRRTGLLAAASAALDAQFTAAEKAATGVLAVERNRLVRLAGAAEGLKRRPEVKAGHWRGSAATSPTSTPGPTSSSMPVAGLCRVEKSFRTAESGPAVGPIHHHTRGTVEAHRTLVPPLCQSPAGSEPPTGPSRSSGRLCIFTARSRSGPANSPSYCPRTRRSTRSTAESALTNMAQIGQREGGTYVWK